jgi:leader peptidase (prepilin peptidase)/N-methyltransferase
MPSISRGTVQRLVTLLDFPPTFLRVFAGLFGLLWGSFLNVVIYRVPRGMSVAYPPSHCPACAKPVRPWLNLPVLSYVILRGRASCCGAKMSPRYPMVELIGGVLSLAVLELTVLPLPHPDTSIWRALAIYSAGLCFALALVATVFIDLEHLSVLPDKANAALAVLGLATASLRESSFVDGLIGVAVGLGAGLAINGIYKLLRGRPGFASGDSVLLGVVGAWFGWPGALFALLGGAVQGTVLLILFWALGGKVKEPASVAEERAAILKEIEELPEDEREEAMQQWKDEDEAAEAPGEGMLAALPFGPFIGLAGLELLLFGNTLRDAFFLWVQP